MISEVLSELAYCEHQQSSW